MRDETLRGSWSQSSALAGAGRPGCEGRAGGPAASSGGLKRPVDSFPPTAVTNTLREKLAQTTLRKRLA